MKQYPSIYTTPNYSESFVVFDKLDGSNIRAEWSRKRGFYKHGSRTQLLSTEQEILYPSIEMIEREYAPALASRFKKAGFESAVCFFEYYGPNSFAGSHNPTDKMELVLIDIAPYKKGILSPKEFLELAEGLKIPNILHKGKIGAQIIQDVRNGTFPGVTFEGIVCKGPYQQKLGHPVMFKVKSQAWLDKLKTICGDNEELYNKLV